MTTASAVTKANPREVLAQRLIELAHERPELVALAADLAGSNKFSEFSRTHPDRFFNVGIAEQNLMSVSAGLALEGKIPFPTTFAAFASMRAHEQVRTDIAYPNLPVKIIATVGGLAGGVMGPTHHGMEDIGTMRMMPNMTVVAPGDPLQLRSFVDQAYALPGPVYVRLGRGEDPVVYPEGVEPVIGRAITARDGDDITIVATGTVLSEAVRASDALRAEGIHSRVLDMHTIRPLDATAVLAAARETGHIVTVEDHTVINGLGSAVAEVLAESGVSARLVRLGIPDVFALVGVQKELYQHYGLDHVGISEAARSMLRTRSVTG